MSTVEVHVELAGKAVFTGVLFSHLRRGREGTTFRYEPGYFNHAGAYALESAMPLVSGDFAFQQGLPRSFCDASPDRWGRNLIEKGLRQQWADTGQQPRTITEMDYLLGVSDFSRQGALRFRQSGSRQFAALGEEVPKLIALPKLLAASNRLCSAKEQSEGTLEAVKTLLGAGTGSLGGARPKATVIDTEKAGQGMLHIAKFPHPNDKWDVMRWEKIALDLAADAGITVPENRLITVEDANILLLKRFDRSDDGERIGYMSAMTLLESEEGESGDYLDIADSLTEISGSTSEDLAELWRRLIFSLLINNTDDHLRNHAVLRSGAAWRLSPAFDLNPNPGINDRRVTSIQGATTFEAGWTAANEAHEWFGLSEAAARDVRGRVFDAVRGWERRAIKHGATKAELELFRPVLERAYGYIAR
ncbi:MAG TPA: hypothetical protein DEB24_07800 [Coriobacteriia bacterium]|nr:hypothetical protein [Coriobacteriia bacterium]